jgi:hypothetical protein
MKKMIYLMLLLMVLSAASMKAQVTIGSDADPDESAVLDLQSTDKGLLIPRIALDAIDSPAPLAEKVAGMVVYNTGEGTLKDTGIYYNDGTNWIKIGNGELNGLTSVNVEANGLTKNSDGTTTTLGLPAGTASGQVLTYDGDIWHPATPAVPLVLERFTVTHGAVAANALMNMKVPGMTLAWVCVANAPAMVSISTAAELCYGWSPMAYSAGSFQITCVHP